MEYTGICIECGAEKALKWPKPLTQAECNLLATDKCRAPAAGDFCGAVWRLHLLRAGQRGAVV